MPLVLDASVTLAWAFQAPDGTHPVLQHLLSDDALVPDIWPSEVANGLLVSVRRSLLTAAQRDAFLHRLHRLPVIVETTGAERTFTVILTLAEQHGLTVYDASYLELAGARAAPWRRRMPPCARRRCNWALNSCPVVERGLQRRG